MPFETESDLRWTAFLYVTGDLTPDESSSFERRLADDQEAREAVAEAVELAGALALVGGEFAPSQRTIGRRALLPATLIGLAAGLLLAVLASLRPAGPPPPDAAEVALTWSGLRAGVDADWSSFVAGSSPIDHAEPGLEVDDQAGVEPSNDRALPSWLLSAASAPLDDPNLQED